MRGSGVDAFPEAEADINDAEHSVEFPCPPAFSSAKVTFSPTSGREDALGADLGGSWETVAVSDSDSCSVGTTSVSDVDAAMIATSGVGEISGNDEMDGGAANSSSPLPRFGGAQKEEVPSDDLRFLLLMTMTSDGESPEATAAL